MKPSEALKIAKLKLQSGWENYICIALPENDAGSIVKNYILTALCGNYAYGEWLYIYHPVLYKTMSLEDRRQGRLQWIDWMIEQYEGIGQ